MQKEDWKAICGMLPALRERYLAEQNARLARLLAEPGQTDTERFWNTFEEMRRQSKVLRECLDGYSRSSMWMNMRLMLRVGMLKPQDLAAFSDELRETLTPAEA
jgi:hypothetical protein